MISDYGRAKLSTGAGVVVTVVRMWARMTWHHYPDFTAGTMKPYRTRPTRFLSKAWCRTSISQVCLIHL